MIYKNIEIAPYNPAWPLEFEKEAAKIKVTLCDDIIAIHHIGSTSVPGLSAKPIIDIILECKDNQNSIKPLQNIGYEYRGEFNIPFRNYFCKKDQRKVNLHVFEQGNSEIELNLKFRDYLRTHPDARIEYEQLKHDLLSQEYSFQKNNSMFTGYNLVKDQFIRKILLLSAFNKIQLLQVVNHKEWQEYHRIQKIHIFEHLNIIYDYNHSTITAPNHFHFVLCKGTKIVTVAHVQFLETY